MGRRAKRQEVVHTNRQGLGTAVWNPSWGEALVRPG